MWQKATKKPVTIEYVQYTGENKTTVEKFMDRRLEHTYVYQEGMKLIIPTLEGEHLASINDMIIRGVKGEFYPCKPDIFEKTYDLETT